MGQCACDILRRLGWGGAVPAFSAHLQHIRETLSSQGNKKEQSFVYGENNEMQGSGHHLMWACVVAREGHGQTCMPGNSPAERREKASLDHPCWVLAVSQDLHTETASAPRRCPYLQYCVGSPPKASRKSRDPLK